MQNIQLESEKAKFSTASSDVYFGVYDYGTKVAVKVLRVYTAEDAVQKVRSSDSGVSQGCLCKVQSFHNEVVAWRHLRHPNIVPFLGVCDKSTLCFVSHWMEQGTLLHFFKHHPSERRTSYVSFKRMTCDSPQTSSSSPADIGYSSRTGFHALSGSCSWGH
jgi:serine/threonine protein kinase